MIQHVAFFKLKPEVTPEKLEEMLRTTRSSLLKIPEILSVRSGKKIDPDCEWPFFISLEFESRDKQHICKDDAIYVKFVSSVIKPHVIAEMSMDYELEPGKDIRYS